MKFEQKQKEVETKLIFIFVQVIDSKIVAMMRDDGKQNERKIKNEHKEKRREKKIPKLNKNK